MKEAPRMDSSRWSKKSEWVLKREMAKMTKTKRKYSEDNAVTSLKWNVRQTTDDVVKEFMCVNVWRQLRHSRRTMTSLVGRRDCHVEKRLFPTRMSDNIKKTILPSITSWRQLVVYNAVTYDVYWLTKANDFCARCVPRVEATNNNQCKSKNHFQEPSKTFTRLFLLAP